MEWIVIKVLYTKKQVKMERGVQEESSFHPSFPICHLIYFLTGNQCLTSWVSTQHISQQAAFLGELADVDSRAQWLFPQIRVTCSTTITKLRFTGETLQGSNRKIPELQIWRRESPTSTRYSKIHYTPGNAVVTVEWPWPNIYAMSVSWPVQPGDVFGVYQPKRSRYRFVVQETGGEELSYMLRNRQRAPDKFDISNYDSSGHPYPLVSVEAGTCMHNNCSYSDNNFNSFIRHPGNIHR